MVFFELCKSASYDAGFKGRRFLIVGESHYDKWKYLGILQEHELPRDFTKECIKELFDGTPGARYWNRLRYRLGDREQSPPEFWNQVAFYNFNSGADFRWPWAAPVAGTVGPRRSHSAGGGM